MKYKCKSIILKIFWKKKNKKYILFIQATDSTFAILNPQWVTGNMLEQFSDN